MKDDPSRLSFFHLCFESLSEVKWILISLKLTSRKVIQSVNPSCNFVIGLVLLPSSYTFIFANMSFRLDLSPRRSLSQDSQEASLPSPLTVTSTTSVTSSVNRDSNEAKEDDRRTSSSSGQMEGTRSPHESSEAVITSPTEPPSPSSLQSSSPSFSDNRKERDTLSDTSTSVPPSVHDLVSSPLMTKGISSEDKFKSQDGDEEKSHRLNSRRRPELTTDEDDQENLKNHKMNDPVLLTTATLLEEPKKDDTHDPVIESTVTTPIPVLETKEDDKFKNRKLANLRPKLRKLKSNLTDVDKKKKWTRITYASYVKPRRIVVSQGSLVETLLQDTRPTSSFNNKLFMHRSSKMITSFPNETIHVSLFLTTFYTNDSKVLKNTLLLYLNFYLHLLTWIFNVCLVLQENASSDSANEREALELSSSEVSKVSLNDVRDHPKSHQQERNPSSAFNLLKSRGYERHYYYRDSPNKNIPKLLLPKSARPRMYSLDGFIPKPNIQKFSQPHRLPPTVVESSSTENLARESHNRRNSWKSLPVDDEYSARKRVRLPF